MKNLHTLPHREDGPKNWIEVRDRLERRAWTAMEAFYAVAAIEAGCVGIAWLVWHLVKTH